MLLEERIRKEENGVKCILEENQILKIKVSPWSSTRNKRRKPVNQLIVNTPKVPMRKVSFCWNTMEQMRLTGHTYASDTHGWRSYWVCELYEVKGKRWGSPSWKWNSVGLLYDVYSDDSLDLLKATSS